MLPVPWPLGGSTLGRTRRGSSRDTRATAAQTPQPGVLEQRLPKGRTRPVAEMSRCSDPSSCTSRGRQSPPRRAVRYATNRCSVAGSRLASGLSSRTRSPEVARMPWLHAAANPRWTRRQSAAPLRGGGDRCDRVVRRRIVDHDRVDAAGELGRRNRVEAGADVCAAVVGDDNDVDGRRHDCGDGRGSPLLRRRRRSFSCVSAGYAA